MTSGPAAMADIATVAEQFLLDFIRVVLLGAGAAWGALIVLAILTEALRTRRVNAALREVGVTNGRPVRTDGAPREAPRAPRPGNERPDGTRSADTPRRERPWARGG